MTNSDEFSFKDQKSKSINSDDFNESTGPENFSLRNYDFCASYNELGKITQININNNNII